MAKAKAPAMQFYVKDWLGDPQLKMASHTSKGIWIDLLCYMWQAPERGKLEGTREQFVKMLGATEKDFDMFLDEVNELEFAHVTKTTKKYLICNRRMLSEFIDKENNRLRQRKFRGIDKCNEDVTSLSSSSSSSSTTTTNKKEINGGDNGLFFVNNDIRLKLPDFFNNDGFRECFLAFRDHRTKLRRPLTQRAAQNLITKLEKLSSCNSVVAVAVMDQTLENGWQGVFELKHTSTIGKSAWGIDES